MRPEHKNKIFECLINTQYGIDKFAFGHGVYGKKDGEVITYDDSFLQFYIMPSPMSFEEYSYAYSRYEPGFGSESNNRDVPFDQLFEKFKEWVGSHVRKLYNDRMTADLWSEYLKGGRNLDIEDIDYTETEKFSDEDKINVRLSLGDLKGLIQDKLKTTPTEQEIIVKRLDYLAGAVDRLPKTDWKGIVISTVFGIVTTLTLDTERGKMLWDLFAHVFRVIKLIPLRTII